jgi:hypothetical protein
MRKTIRILLGIFYTALWMGLFIRNADASPHKKLLILGVDGCRPDALLKCRAPNLRALAESGTYTWYALSRPPTKSGPCWSSIFTGVWNDKHGVTDNTFANQRFDLYPMLFKRMKGADPSFYSGWFVYWPDLGTAMPHGADVSSGGWSDPKTLEAAVGLLKNGDPDALFVHFGAIDAAGHASGFDPDGPEYLAAIEEADGRVGEVLSAMKSRPGYPDEGWMVVALTDHGGFKTHHGGSTLGEMRTFFIVSGDGVPRGEMGHDWISKTFDVPPYGIRLDGRDDRIEMRDGPQYRFGSDSDFTVEFCIRTSGWTGRPVMIGNKDMDDEKNPGFAFVLIDEGKWRVNVADGTAKGNISGPVIDDGIWHHIAAVFRRGGTLTLFQDGIRTGALDISQIGSIDTPYGIVIGGDAAHPNSAFASASVSEVRIWRTALEDGVIRDWLFTPVTSAHPNQADLAGYWKMNDGGGALVKDFSAFANHGTLNGGDPDWIVPNEQVETLLFDSCRAAKTVDLTVTALAHFGIESDPAWRLDGQNLVPRENPGAVGERRAGPSAPSLLENYPNPFNGRSTIVFSLQRQGRAVLKIFDLSGREKACLVDEFLPAGRQSLEFSANRLPSGVYVLSLASTTARLNKKILLMK